MTVPDAALPSAAADRTRLSGGTRLVATLLACDGIAIILAIAITTWKLGDPYSGFPSLPFVRAATALGAALILLATFVHVENRFAVSAANGVVWLRAVWVATAAIAASSVIKPDNPGNSAPIAMGVAGLSLLISALAAILAIDALRRERIRIAFVASWAVGTLIVLAAAPGIADDMTTSRATRTQMDMRRLASALENLAETQHAYPRFESIDGMSSLMPFSERSLMHDRWGTPFRAWSNGKDYEIVSAGADRRFEPAHSTTESIYTTDGNRDIVLRDGSFVQGFALPGPY